MTPEEYDAHQKAQLDATSDWIVRQPEAADLPWIEQQSLAADLVSFLDFVRTEKRDRATDLWCGHLLLLAAIERWVHVCRGRWQGHPGVFAMIKRMAIESIDAVFPEVKEMAERREIPSPDVSTEPR
jgi:hypothetical protein